MSRKYLLFGLSSQNRLTTESLQIFEENNTKPKYSLNDSEISKNYIELKNNCSYFIKLTMKGYDKYTTIKKNIFYFAQSDYYKQIFQAEINTEYFQEFPLTYYTKILLDLTSIKWKYDVN